jgi:hypothetical protein
MKTLTILSLLLVSVPSLYSQQPQASATPPQPPFLNRAPASSQWIITFKPQETASAKDSSMAHAAGGASTPRPKVMVVTKNGSTIDEKLVNENGVIIETWLVSGYAVSAVNGKDPVLSPSPGNTFNTTDYSAADFAGFDWISPQNFVGAKEIMGRHCLVFKSKIVTMEPTEISILKNIRANEIDAQKEREEEAAKAARNHANHIQPAEAPIAPFNPDDFKVEVAAYIDDQSRLPVALVYGTPNGVMTRTYQFQPSPASVVLPPDVSALLKKTVERRNRM